MKTHIEVEEYCFAFETWALMCLNAKRLTEENYKTVLAGCDHIRYMFIGEFEIKELCEELEAWALKQPNIPKTLILDASKSCLLDRLIYGSEPLREKMCPKHKGKWSGCHWDPCPHGCNYGMNFTGWIP